MRDVSFLNVKNKNGRNDKDGFIRYEKECKEYGISY